MLGKSMEGQSRREFKPASVPGLTEGALEAVNAALKSLSTWRNQIAETNEENGERVIGKMADAAAALGWPKQIVETARTQMQSIADMQIKAMDQVMDAWEEQLKLPRPMMASPSAMLSKLKWLPDLPQSGAWPGAEAFQNAAMNPFQLWLQLGEQWQKSWTDMMSAWSKTTRLH